MIEVAIHNRIADDIMKLMLEPITDHEGDYTDVLLLLESIITGIVLGIVKEGSEETVLDKVVETTKKRMAMIRLSEAAPHGNA